MATRIMRNHTNTDAGEFYQLLTSCVVPRPIAWVSSRSTDGVNNLAPYSFFSVCSTNPPIVQFTSVGGRKDSARNAEESGEFVINIVTESLALVANATSAPFDAHTDEFEAAEITSAPADVVSCLRVHDSPIAIECRTHRLIDVGDSVLVMGDVVAITIDDAVVADDGWPDFATLAPMRRLGRLEWGHPGPTSESSRPST